MDISYLGHSCFKLRGGSATVVTDPFGKNVGLPVPKVSADLVTVSHDHEDHNFISAVSGTSRRAEPFVVRSPGEYDIGGVGVVGIGTFHDDAGGKERGKNTAFVIHVDGVSVAHLGDLGHTLSEAQIEQLGSVDVLLCPVGGFYTIDAKTAAAVVEAISPSIVIPMHFNRKELNQTVFEKLTGVEAFLEAIGAGEAKRLEKLTVTPASLPEETEVVVLI